MSVQTTEDGTDSSLPSFSTFTTELDPSWDYYDRDRSSSDVITSHNNSYTRPWEMETKEKGFEPFSKLPSFQSQFHSYGETNMMPEPSLPQVTPVPVPMSPNSAATASPGHVSLTQLTPINPLQNGLAPLTNPSFHTLTAVNSRPYPLVPAPIQARDIPAINQQYMDERHIQLYQPITTYTHAHVPQNVVTVLKSEPANYELKNGLHHTSFQNPMIDNGFDGMKIENNHKIVTTPIRNNNDARKKERRKIRASSLESSAESESSAMEMNDGNPGQVAAISSTASFKSPISSVGVTDEDTNGEKQVKYILIIHSFHSIRIYTATYFSIRLFPIRCRQRKSVNVAANALVVKRKTIAAIVPHVVTIKVIRFVNNVVAKNSPTKR